MKISLKLFALVIIISFSSCGTEELTEISSETSPTIAKSITYINPGVERLHNIMQWKAYLISRVLLNDNAARAQFLAVYQANGDVIKLSDLINDTYQAEVFRNALRNEFHKYILNPDFCPQTFDRTSQRPTPPQLPGHPSLKPGHISWVFNTSGDEFGVTEEETNEERFQHYLELILEDNCLEIYLPNGYRTNARNIYSSAHPLLDQNFNDEAYRHASECDIDPTNITEGNNSKRIIIIVRPYRDGTFLNPTCAYSQFDFNFTDFFN